MGVLISAVLDVAELDAAEAQSPRPNIVVVLVDDLRWDELGCVGHPYVKTPHIDRIAREGAVFTNAFCTTPLCSPSRASFLTGQYAHAHGIIDNTDRSKQSHQLATFPRDLQRAGYETAFIGKWHMGVDGSARPGFDHWVSMAGQGAFQDPELIEDGQTHLAKGYVTDILNDRAVSFVKRAHEKPFLLYLSHKAVHPNIQQFADGRLSDPSADKFLPAERHVKLYADSEVPRRPNALAGPKGKPALERKIGELPPLSVSTGSKDESIRDRQRMLASIDDGVGLLLDTLSASGQLDNTLFIFTSDHGYFYGEHGLSVERRLAYEEAIRIPLLVRYPRLVKAGMKIEPLVQSIDLAPTLLEVAGTKPSQKLPGRSLLPLLEGKSPEWRQSLLIEYFSDTVFPRIHKMGYQAVRTDRYKLIHYTDLDGMDELYDLKADPYEMHNLIDDPQAQPTRDSLRKELIRLFFWDMR